METMFNWLKNRTYIILLIVFGIGFLTYTDNWQVYTEPIKKAEAWVDRSVPNWNRPESVIPAGEQKEPETVSEEVGVLGDNITDEASTEEATQEITEDVSGTENTVLPQEPGCLNPPEVLYKTVDDDYFSDAVFIGDSRTVGMYEYGGLEETATFYASTGLTVYKMFDSPIIKVPGQRKKQTVEEALQTHSFAKIYLMIGINEMGTGTVDTFIAKYAEAVEHLRELQPDAIIYLQGIMKVTTERSEQGDYITNEGIEARNVEIAKLADNSRIYYLDVNPLICDDTGGMEPSYTFDGVHLKAQYISVWKDYLKEHAVVLP